MLMVVVVDTGMANAEDCWRGSTALVPARPLATSVASILPR
jgi:hypothetical protein